MDDIQFRKLLDFFLLSFSGYRKVRKGVKKRISRHMQSAGCTGMDEYIDLLERDSAARKESELLLTVSISRFFRDKMVWTALEALIPKMIVGGISEFRAWSAGCACGEEAYSFRILWERFCRPVPDLKIIGSDVNPLCLERAAKGEYQASSLKEVDREIREEFFVRQKTGNRFTVMKEIRAGVEWERRSLFSNPPGASFHLIFLRNNLLTYYTEKLSAPAFDRIFDALEPGGLLVVGAHEKPPPRPGLERTKASPLIYIKQDGVGCAPLWAPDSQRFGPLLR